MRTAIIITIEQSLRPRLESTPSVAEMLANAETVKSPVQNEVVYIAHIEIPGRGGHHHSAEGPTPAMALVDAALHWERYERGRR